MAVPISVPCNEERIGIQFHTPGPRGSSSGSARAGPLGSGTSNSLAILSAAKSIR